ncbi:MAG: Cd(II)/Pb(II)-responsive transcriptional regulator [Candidatus Thiodiazotropha taylori]|uniref:Cd(II)/Pb(II)-responsive transcriptional regulator n=1 Tax=Candidatus Thiodiazotropha taylori TaxID=2792791 RepID=A0A9E4KGY4_9GAMM|nr:Cd(II)/Pb(II)-responsive transcriptional regulator [Aestuariicella albida]MCG7947328.1 Cd(II)/Pb(II)-responsive transcriptional regulator [Candidatus Thiodiazotropha taylori]MCW4257449.1 Cd(II)/Pb(II)-responsive transcriptional regulator [Candidatus Thiodiazotropha taylori]
MKIGELAKSSGCSVQTIRYYEREGLISAPSRSEGNFRLYDSHTLEKLLFIKHCRSLDLALKEIKQLIQLQSSPESNCDEVNNMIDTQLNLVESRIEELKKLHLELSALRHRCERPNTIDQCGIIEGLAEHAIRQN